MAGKAIVARLELNSSDYEQKIAKAKESTRKFSKEGGKGLTDMVGKFKGIAVAVAGSKAAMEVFNRVVASSQTLTDTYARTMDAARTSADQFFYSIGSGDFTAFNNGLDGIIRKSKEASRALDDLGTYDIVLGYFREKYSSGFRTSIASAKDKQATPEERAAAKAAAEGYFESYKTAIEGKESELREALSAVVSAAGSNIDSVSLEKIEEILEQAVIFGKSGKYAEAYKAYKRLPDLQKSYDNAVANALSAKGKTTWGDQARATKAEMERLRAILDEVGEEEAKIYNVLLERFSDKKLAENLGLASSLRAGQRELAEWQTAMNELNNQLNQPIKPGTVGAAITKKLTGEQYGQSFGVNYYNTLGNTLAGKAQQGYIPIQSVPIISDDIIEESLPQVAAQAAKVAEESYSAAEGIYSISNALGNLSGMMGDNTAKWVSWGASMLGAVGQFVQAINGGGGLSLLSPASALLSSFVGMPMGGASRNNEIRLRVQGSDLVGSINNYNSINSRRY